MAPSIFNTFTPRLQCAHLNGVRFHTTLSIDSILIELHLASCEDDCGASKLTTVAVGTLASFEKGLGWALAFFSSA
jgi:hypothetical protein